LVGGLKVVKKSDRRALASVFYFIFPSLFEILNSSPSIYVVGGYLSESFLASIDIFDS
jgi:hypothetical protein